MTANALASVSLEPLLVLVCVEREARFHDAIVESGLWGVSILPSTARATADWLATRGRPLHGQLDRIPIHRGGTGVALLDESLSTLECETRMRMRVATTPSWSGGCSPWRSATRPATRWCTTAGATTPWPDVS